MSGQALPVTARLGPGHDTIVRDALLGLQFRDAATGRVVAEGLQVLVEDLWQRGRTQALAANRSGVFALHAFAGLRGFGDDDAGSPPQAGRWRVSVRDPLGRYVATRVFPLLPSPGLYSPALAPSPPDQPPHVPLFSTATRPPPVGHCSLRAELRAAGDHERAVAWARLELWLGAERLAEGLSDEAGRAHLVFPLPRPRPPALRTSPAAGGTPWSWSVTLRAFHDPALTAAEVPDLEDVYRQPEVALQGGAGPLAPLVLRAGETLVASSPPSSFLFVAE